MILVPRRHRSLKPYQLVASFAEEGVDEPIKRLRLAAC